MGSPPPRENFAHIWGFHVSAFNPEPRRRMDQDEGNPLALRPLDMQSVSFRWLSQIINRCQRHKCSPAYCLRRNKRKAREAKEHGRDPPEPECRFGFPRPLCDRAELITLPGKTWWSFQAQRNDPWLNQYSRIITFAWLANTDISPCTSVEAVINYAAKYCAKAENKTASYADLARQVFPKVFSAKPMLRGWQVLASTQSLLA